jgi:pSer/pThr/pTyr-binding forkhead associated (FHA) protein
VANDSYQLVVRNAPQSGLAPGQVIAIEDDVLTLGRDPLSDIILDDPEVSRHHAKLLMETGGYAIQDMGSTNGTFVDGKRLTGEPMTLKPGQVIMLGSNVTLVYQAMVAADPMATVVAPVAPVEPEAPEELDELVELEVVADEEVAAVEEAVEEVAAEFDESVPAIEPLDLPLEEVEEPEFVAEDIIEEEEEDFATIMDESPLAAPVAEPEPEPLPEITPEPEPLPELPDEPELLAEEPMVDIEPPPIPGPPVATFEDIEERTYIDSAAPVSDFDETPIERASELPPVPPPPPLPDLDQPEEKGSSNRNLIIIAVVAVVLICCCIAILAGAALFTEGFSNFNF